ncbi:MAG: hypothetical protein FWG70_08625 [Oscillospiraceae bacterium]|nr:hypothetical protein [Oscillospiraceae bacterium]
MLKIAEKIICVIMVTIITLSVTAISISASSGITIEEFAEEIREKYKTLYTDEISHYIIDYTLWVVIPDPQFVYTFNDSIEDAYEVMEATLDSSLPYTGNVDEFEFAPFPDMSGTSQNPSGGEMREPTDNPDTGVSITSGVVISIAFTVLAILINRKCKKWRKIERV